MVSSATEEFILYGRISPRPKKNESTKMQIELGRSEVERRNQLGRQHGVIIGEFTDEMLSGGRSDDWKRGKKKGTPYRPGWSQALRMACKHKATIIVYKYDRISRSLVDSLRIADLIKKSGANILTLSGFAFDTSTHDGEMMFRIQLAVLENICKAGAERTSDAMLYYQSIGIRMSGHSKIPYGTMCDPNDDKRIIGNPEEIANRDFMMQLREENYGYQRIAIALNLRGKYRRCGSEWDATGISLIVKREIKKRERLIR